ncbi:MAG: YidB family protein [Acidobacteriota bacterium]
MGLIDDILKELDGGAGAPGSSADTGGSQKSLATELLELVTGGGSSGGLTGLVNIFKEKGLGDVMSSWVSTGKNLPISAEQIQAVLGSARVRELAAKAGISPEMASNAISRLLPQLVDRVTPNGRIPAAGDLLNVISKMFRKP